MSNSVTFSFNLNIPTNVPVNVPCSVTVSLGQPYITHAEPKQAQLPIVPQYPYPVHKPRFTEVTTKVKNAKNLDLNWSEDGF
jgi:hypothetical protein